MTHLLRAIGAATLVATTGAMPAAMPWRQRSPAAVAIPFELATRHVIVQVSVNGSRPLSFVLDTGADMAIIRMDVAKELGLSLHGTASTGGAGAGTQAGMRVRDASWSLIGLDRFRQPVSLALPLPRLSPGMGRAIDGIIGGQFIRQFVVELDYDKRVLTLHDRESFVYRGRGDTLPLDFTADGHPVVRATVTPLAGAPIERRFMLDIGSGLALALHSPFVAEQRLLGPGSTTIRAIGMAGAGGRSFGRLGRVGALQLGSVTFKEPLTLFSEDKAGAFANASLAGNIGAQIMNRFRSFLDYGRRRLILEPAPTIDAPFDRAFSGLALRAEGADFRTFRVHDVLEQSPATEAGIREGDVITSVDGRPAESLTLTTIAELFETPAVYRLTIRRGDEAITVTLTPRRLV